MRLWMVTVGAPADEARAALVSTGASVEGVSIPSDPSRAELDDALERADGRRLVIRAGTADLGRVLRRMMRRDQLASVETAILPLSASPFLARFGVVPDLAVAARVAVSPVVRTVGVLKDDSGQLLIDEAVLTPWAGRRVWVRAYVDDDRLCDGEIASLTVARGPSGGLVATARGGRFGRARTRSGRGLTLACDDAAISTDGVGREQPRRKRIWWDEPDQWRLAVPFSPTLLAASQG